jgi:SAM-dependent methyltransferase
MIERFGVRVRKEGLSKAEGRVIDCHALDLPDDSFDVTGSQFGVMLVPDQPHALREMVRVTRPGGRVLVIAYGSPVELEFLQFFIGALMAVAPEFKGLPDDPPPLEFQVSDPDVLRQRLTDAGLRDVRVERTAERADVRLGRGNVGLGPVRQSDPQPTGRRPHRGATSPSAPGPRRHAPRAHRNERASGPHERGNISIGTK